MTFVARPIGAWERRARLALGSIVIFGIPGAAVVYALASVAISERRQARPMREESAADACRDAAPYLIERALKPDLSDPDSYRRDALTMGRAPGRGANAIAIALDYHAKNALGAYAPGRAVAVINLQTCAMIDVDLPRDK